MRHWTRWGCVCGLLALCTGAVLAEGKKAPSEEREGGILGTGIVGTITALGSIEVNGQRVVFDPQMMAGGPLGEISAQALVPGMVVVAEAMPHGTDWMAQRLEQFVPVMGPAEVTGGVARILGVEIELAPGAAALDDGRWYVVSGLWKGQAVMASRVTGVPPQAQALVRGTYIEGRVGGVPVTLPQSVPEGAAVQVRLRLEPGAAPAAVAYREGLFDAPLQQVIAQGYLSEPTAQGHYTVLGSGLMAQTDTPSMIDPEAQGVFCAVPAAEPDEMARISPMGSQGC